MGPFSLGLIRFSLSAIILLVVMMLQAKEKLLPPRDMLLCALTGLVGTTLYFAGENYGVMLLPASTSSLVVGAFPAMTLVLECICDHTRPRNSMAAGIVLAFVGVAVLALTEDGGSGQTNVVLGLLALLGGGACWAVYNILMRPLLGSYSTLTITAWQTLFGALGFIPFALAEGLPSALPSTSSLFALAYLVLGCTVFGFMLYNFGLKGLGATEASALVNLIPVFGLVLSALILSEPIGLRQIVGGALVVGGIFLSARQ